MKKLILLLLIPCISYGQEISISPTSVVLWGQTSQTLKVTGTYKSLEFMYLRPYTKLYDKEEKIYQGDYFSVFWNPLSFERNNFSLNAGIGYFFRKFPTVNGTKTNLQLKMKYYISDSIGLMYSHISNGFGMFCKYNPGVDNFSLIIRI